MSSRLIVPLLEAIAATVEMQPWGVAAIHSADMVLLWDSRDDASLIILEAVAGQRGTVVDQHSIKTQAGREIAAVLVAPSFTNQSTVGDIAGGLRMNYTIATSQKADETERPF